MTKAQQYVEECKVWAAARPIGPSEEHFLGRSMTDFIEARRLHAAKIDAWSTVQPEQLSFDGDGAGNFFAYVDEGGALIIPASHGDGRYLHAENVPTFIEWLRAMFVEEPA